MAKILINDEWFYAIDPGSLYEYEFESFLNTNNEFVFPGYIPTQFKKTVSYGLDSARADYALISENYSDWWVVEVELSTHSLNQHILPQIKTLANAEYGVDIVEYLCKNNDGFNRIKMEDMIKGCSPKILVVLDRPVPKWITAIERYDVKVAVFEIFRSDLGKFVYRINGFIPKPIMSINSICYLDKTIPSLLVIETPAILDGVSRDSYEIEFEGRKTFWTRLESADCVWLVCKKRNPLTARKKYILGKSEEGFYTIREK